MEKKRQKTGGRTLGTPNKTTTEIRDLISAFVGNNVETLQRDFDQLEAKERLQFFEKFLQYSIPKQREMVEEQKGVQINITKTYVSEPQGDNDTGY